MTSELFLLCLLALGGSDPCPGNTRHFTTNTTIASTDLTHDGACIIVDACTLIVDGVHSFASLSIVNGGVVTHSAGGTDIFPNRPAVGMDLTISGDVSIAPFAAISATGRGYAPLSGPGAGDLCNFTSGPGHGGAGTPEIGGCDAGGITYDSVPQPQDMGSGSYSARGGGSIRLTVSGTLNVEGMISADGAASSDYAGGAGGSVRISCNSLAGTGSISADGGDRGSEANAAGSGGGRVAVEYETSSFPLDNIQARGGEGYLRGGAGTVWIKPVADLATIHIDNGGSVGWATEFYGQQSFNANLVVSGGALIAPRRGQTQLDLAFLGYVIIAADGRISANKLGYAPMSGPGAGSDCSATSGPGHGGAGAPANNGCHPGGICYDSISQPQNMGSGGFDARGGGAIKLAAGGAIIVDGLLSADGESSPNFSGGAGGSVWLTCATLGGSGQISASGGDRGTEALAAGSGGGRIALHYGDSSFPLTNIRARGGSGHIRGGAGTVYLKPAGVLATLYIDNGGMPGWGTEFYGAQSIDADLIVSGGAAIGTRFGQTDFDLTFAGDITIAADGRITADGRGFGPTSGPGAGGNCLASGGGSYGGLGGFGEDGCPPGSIYGSLAAPTDLGSGGGDGGSGGGALKLASAGTITVDGAISANGDTPAFWSGGSGGSVWLTCNTLNGSGMIRANGGDRGVATSAGGGGGGRIAIYAACDSLFPAGNIEVAGGLGWQDGSAGTIYWAGAPSGDMDNSGMVDLLDVEPFVQVLLGNDTLPCRVGTADMNLDGLADGLDIPDFASALLIP